MAFQRRLAILLALTVANGAASRDSRAADPADEEPRMPPAAAGAVDYVRDVKPILQDNCYDCHGPDLQEGGFRLDHRASALAGADSGPVIEPGNSSASRLIRIVAGLEEVPGRMPPEDSGDPLSVEQIGVLRAWIDGGAAWPDAEAGAEPIHAGMDHWSYQPLSSPKVPAVHDAAWVRNPIDAFILAKLEQEGIAPSPEADRRTLLRRVYLDLIGLPPTPAQLATFLANPSATAYEETVDRLLQSPHYGERWGRHWLDEARYADSDGYEKDGGRPFAWRFRDWAIGALNVDMPFDTFTVQQLAGDLLGPEDSEYDDGARVAAGFHRNTLINKEGGVDPEEDRVKRTIDRTNTLGTVWLGLTVGCANCHTHKYDPISQREYFGLYAFFNNLRETDLPVPPQEALDAWRRDSSLATSDRDAGSGDDAGGPGDVPAAGLALAEQPYRLYQSVAEEETPRETYVHVRGDFLSKGPVVQPSTLQVLPKLSSRSATPDRLDLARWVVSRENPLTARVLVNRIWQLHFGRGIVSTPDDFGTQGEPPSHPDLLDWLAYDLQAGGWRLKRFHRLIVTSATYRQSSAARPEVAARDPYNAWLARQNRFRVEAEVVRDLALASSGLLNPAIGGPSVRPPQPPGVAELTFDNAVPWIASVGPDRYRRGLYTWFQRTSPHPNLSTFDAPEANLACTRRERSNTPLQALTLLNDVTFVECAQRLGRDIAAATRDVDESSAVDASVRLAVRKALARDPSPSEATLLGDLYRHAIEQYLARPAEAARLMGAEAPSEAVPTVSSDVMIREAACTIVARVVLNLDEFITRE